MGGDPAQAAVAPAQPETPVSASPSPPQLDFTDARPTKEHATYYVNHWNQYSCEFGVRDLGDELLDRVGQLRHDLMVAYGDRMAGKKVVVDHYHLYLNQTAMVASHYWGTAFAGVLAAGAGAGAKTTKPGCQREKMKGWFDPAELTTPWSPFIVEIEVHIDGQDHLVHSVYSPSKNMPAPGVLTDFDMKAEQDAAHAAVDKANAAMISEVSGQLGTPVASAQSGSIR